MFPKYNNTFLHSHSTIFNINSFDYNIITHKYFNLIYHSHSNFVRWPNHIFYKISLFSFVFFCSSPPSPFHTGPSLGSKIVFTCHISLDFFNLEYFHSLSLSLMTVVFLRMSSSLHWHVVETPCFCVYRIFTCFHSEQDYYTDDKSSGHHSWRHILSTCSLLVKFILVSWTIIFMCDTIFSPCN